MSRSLELIERSEPLLEMATLVTKSDGFGIVIKIFSNYHNPPHMHVFDLNSKFLYRVLIPTKDPDITDIESDDIDLSITQKKVILRALKSYDRNTGFPIWRGAVFSWNIFHPDSRINIDN